MHVRDYICSAEKINPKFFLPYKKELLRQISFSLFRDSFTMKL